MTDDDVTLKLDNLGLTEMPTDFDPSMDLQQIRRLSLKGNQLTSLGGDLLRRLSNLQEIDLSGNLLEQIPFELSDCRALKSVVLDDNRIQEVEVFGHLPALERLSLKHCGVEIVSESINKLSSLKFLDLSENLLYAFPNRLHGLPQLRELYCNDNPLFVPGDNIVNLKNLVYLDLSDNSLTDLPNYLANLRPDAQVGLSGNLLHEAFGPSFDERSAENFRSLLRSRARDAVQQYEAKVLLVGEGNVGKTSLVEALRGGPFIRNRSTTHGIEVKPLTVRNQELHTDITMRMWDFGGQEVYRISHQFFFSVDAVYIVVWRPREGSEENAVEAWLRRIRLRVGDQAKVIIVATHGSERQPEIDMSGLRREFGEMLCGSFTVDSETGDGIEEVRRSLSENAGTLPHMGNLVSLQWLEVQKKIFDLNQTHIYRHEFDRLCRTAGLDLPEADALLDMLHRLGLVVSFSDDQSLDDIVVLQPEWLTKAISYVLEDPQTRANHGVLEHGRLPLIWRSIDGEYRPEIHPYFLRLMEKFDVSFRIPEQSASLVSQLLPFEAHDVSWPGQSLRLRCELSEEPPGLIPWLIVRNHRFSTGSHWRSGMVLAHPTYGTEALIRQSGRAVDFAVRGEVPRFFISILRDTLEHLCRTRWVGLDFRFVVPCPQSHGIGAGGCLGSFPLSTLELLQSRQKQSVTCLQCAEEFGISVLLEGFDAAGKSMRQIISQALDPVRQEIRLGVGLMRQILKSIDQEVIDCPRIAVLAPRHRRPLDPRIWSDQWSLTLWCEEPGHEHPMEPPYHFTVSQQWFQAVAPYLHGVMKALTIIAPIGGSAADLLDVNKQLDEALDAMKAVADASGIIVDADNEATSSTGGLSRLQGAGLRQLRELLFKLDPNRQFCGLQRSLSPTGQYLWLCEEHFSVYQPGLPRLPYVTRQEVVLVDFNDSEEDGRDAPAHHDNQRAE